MRKTVDAANKYSTYGLIERLQAENQILKHQVTGYETFFKYKERRKKWGKPLFELQDGETAGWYSPQKVKTAQEQLQQLEEEEKQQQQLKNEQKLRKQQEKAAKQQQVAARKQEPELARAEKAARVAPKKAQKEEEDIQKQAIKQLQNRMKSIKHKQSNMGKKAAQLDSAVEPNSGVGCDDEVVLGMSGSGRMRKQPQHLQDYIL